ncbi:MAG: TAXI family TRAP transporter solute-binding subunit [Alphaproteobacteria bacterium]|nr:TAXI family TRAP transporter solute-binding subunit [Alphaproteobacteria bacterium]
MFKRFSGVNAYLIPRLKPNPQLKPCPQLKRRSLARLFSLASVKHAFSRINLYLFASAFLLTTAVSSVAVKANDELRFFRIGAGPTSETLYALSTAISAGISRPPGTLPCDTLGGVCGVPGLIAVAQSKTGSIENLRDLRTGEVESALVRADVANQAFKGIGPFLHEGENTNLRVIANMFPVTAHIIVLGSSDIHSVSDLKGKKVSIGAEGSGTRLFARAMLQAYDMDLYSIRYRNMLPGTAIDRLAEGELDAAIVIGAAPIDALANLGKTIELRFLPIEGENRETLKRIYAHLEDAQIREGSYGNPKALDTVSIDVQWIVDANADISLIEDITQALWRSETEELFLRNNPQHLFPIRDKSLPHGLIPVHRGAENYYRASGLIQ